jgi:hypothetical protein
MTTASDSFDEPQRITAPAPDRLLVLTEAQRSVYERDGFLVIEGLVSRDWLDRLESVTAEFIEMSRSLGESNLIVDLEPDHTAE